MKALLSAFFNAPTQLSDTVKGKAKAFWDGGWRNKGLVVLGCVVLFFGLSAVIGNWIMPGSGLWAPMPFALATLFVALVFFPKKVTLLHWLRWLLAALAIPGLSAVIQFGDPNLFWIYGATAFALASTLLLWRWPRVRWIGVKVLALLIVTIMLVPWGLMGLRHFNGSVSSPMTESLTLEVISVDYQPENHQWVATFKDDSGVFTTFSMKNDLAFWRNQVDQDAARLKTFVNSDKKLECWTTGIRLNRMKLYPNLIWANPVMDGEKAPVKSQ